MCIVKCGLSPTKFVEELVKRIGDLLQSLSTSLFTLPIKICFCLNVMFNLEIQLKGNGLKHNPVVLLFYQLLKLKKKCNIGFFDNYFGRYID